MGRSRSLGRRPENVSFKAVSAPHSRQIALEFPRHLSLKITTTLRTADAKYSCPDLARIKATVRLKFEA